MVSVLDPVGTELLVPLTIPRKTGPPKVVVEATVMPVGEKGRSASGVLGTVMVSVMLLALIQTKLKLVSGLINPGAVPATVPILVFVVGSEPPTKPVPVRVTVNEVPGVARGKVAG